MGDCVSGHIEERTPVVNRKIPTKPASKVNINDLPNELLELIFTYLTLKERFRYECVCRRWQETIFASVRQLAFGQHVDLFHGYHNHYFNERDQLADNVHEEEVIKGIIAKCGYRLRMFRGKVTPEVMQVVSETCEFLHCISVRVVDLRAIEILTENYAEQLTCLTVCIETIHNFASILSECRNLKYLAFVSPSGPFGHCRLNLLDDSKTASHPLQFCKSLKNLAIVGYITDETMEQLTMFTELQMFSIVLCAKTNQPQVWASVVRNWFGLTVLHIGFRGPNCVRVDPLPPNLECLSLHSTNTNGIIPCFEEDRPVSLPKLKTLRIYQVNMSPSNLEAYLSAFSCCPIENLTIDSSVHLHANNDEFLQPLLSFSSLEHLAIGNDVRLSYSLAESIICELKHLKSIQTLLVIPCSEKFWKAALRKARLSDVVKIVVKVNEQSWLHLFEPFPTNISLVADSSATVKLSHGFGLSHQWQKLATQWSHLTVLNIQIEGTNFQLSGLPDSLEELIVICQSKTSDLSNITPLTFRTELPNLRRLLIWQRAMSNDNLFSILESTSQFCPNLRNLHVNRHSPANENVADNCLAALAKCFDLEVLTFTRNIVVSEEFVRYLSCRLRKLRIFARWINVLTIAELTRNDIFQTLLQMNTTNFPKPDY